VKDIELPEGFHYGKVVCLQGQWGSGLATLIVLNELDVMVSVPCENAATVRAFEVCYGDVIKEGHTFDGRLLAGKEIVYSYDEFGLVLGGFTPLENWDEVLVSMEEVQ
jgi:hypothetical protein